MKTTVAVSATQPASWLRAGSRTRKIGARPAEEMNNETTINLMENVVRILSSREVWAPITKWEFEPRAVRFDYRGTRYRVGLLSMGGVLIEEVGDGVLSSGPKANGMYALLKELSTITV